MNKKRRREDRLHPSMSISTSSRQISFFHFSRNRPHPLLRVCRNWCCHLLYSFSAHHCPLSFSISPIVHEMSSPLQKPFFFFCYLFHCPTSFFMSSLSFLHLPHSSHLFWKKRDKCGDGLGWWKWICVAFHVFVEILSDIFFFFSFFFFIDSVFLSIDVQS